VKALSMAMPTAGVPGGCIAMSDGYSRFSLLAVLMSRGQFQA
jgi:hypothetical protein